MSQRVETEQRSLFVRVAMRMAVIAVVLAVVSTAAAFGGRWSWFCDLATHWPVQIAIGSALTSVVLAMGRRWKTALLAAAIALLNASYIVPVFFAPNEACCLRSRSRGATSRKWRRSRRTDCHRPGPTRSLTCVINQPAVIVRILSFPTTRALGAVCACPHRLTEFSYAPMPTLEVELLL